MIIIILLLTTALRHAESFTLLEKSPQALAVRTPSASRRFTWADAFLDTWTEVLKPLRKYNGNRNELVQVSQQFFQVYNAQCSKQIIDAVVATLDDDCILNDCRYASTCRGVMEVERRLRLKVEGKNQDFVTFVLDDIVLQEREDYDVAGLTFHSEKSGSVLPNSRGAAWVTFTKERKISGITWTVEASWKQGEASLRLLRFVSEVIRFDDGHKDKTVSPVIRRPPPVSSPSVPAPLKYYEYWNVRDIESAVSLFSEDVVYDDTAFPKPFRGKDALKRHLSLCAQALPPSLTFRVIDHVQESDIIMTRWTVENNGKEQPFSNGISFYKLEGNNKGRIQSGVDFVDARPVKFGGPSLFAESMKRKINEEPIRLLPLLVWLTYMYVVFISDGILPGANALQLEPRTWEEVRDLSLNFFLVAPLLHLPFSPTVHPMLEGVFNLLLAWAAMFAGFFSDERKDNPQLFPVVPAVVGMQLLTSAFLLPYLATRTTERRSDVSWEELPVVAQWFESRILGVALAVVGSGSIVWSLFSRYAEFGGLSERWATFLQLLSIDRVGTSFIVDLVIFGLFQGWLVSDDLRRRGGDSSSESSRLFYVASYIPFFGLAAYLTFRPAFPKDVDGQ